MDADTTIAAVRRFNRFYTKRIGVLTRGILESPHSLTEARVLFELAQGEVAAASALCESLGVDQGYMSRILTRFERNGLIRKRRSDADRRRWLLELTPRGREEFAGLDARASEQVRQLLAELGPGDRQRLVDSLASVSRILGATETASLPCVLRPHGPGDIGWVTRRHGVLYAEEFGFDERFEALVAGILARFVEDHDPRRERLWIAEIGGEAVGSVAIMRAESVEPSLEETAQLRLMLVEPRARGRGVGEALMNECLRFARGAGYSRMILWTQSILHAARRLYARHGFQRIDEKPHNSWGKELVAEVCERSIRP